MWELICYNIEASREPEKFDADLYMDLLRSSHFLNSPDMSKSVLRTNPADRSSKTQAVRSKSGIEKDEEYSRYSNDKSRRIQRMSSKNIPMQRLYSQPKVPAPQTQRAQDFNNIMFDEDMGVPMSKTPSKNYNQSA